MLTAATYQRAHFLTPLLTPNRMNLFNFCNCGVISSFVNLQSLVKMNHLGFVCFRKKTIWLYSHFYLKNLVKEMGSEVQRNPK